MIPSKANNGNPAFKDTARKRANLAMQIGLEGGKLPPSAIELEEVVLGGLMLEKDNLAEVVEFLKPEHFYKESNKKIFEAILDLYQKNDPVDILTVSQQLRKNAVLDFVGGSYYISSLSNRVSSSANVVFHARIIQQKFISREMISINSESQQQAYEDTIDVFEQLDDCQSKLFQLSEGVMIKSYQKMNSLLLQSIKNIEIAAKLPDGITGVQTGFRKLDYITNGWQPSDLIIIAARPGMGKTAFVLSMARNIAVRYKKPIAVFSLEMSALQLTGRLISSETGIDSNSLKKGNLNENDWGVLHNKISALNEAPLYIDDTPSLSLFELRAKCRRLKQQHDIQCVVIDYLQLMTVGGNESKGWGGNREQEISTISRGLKSLAKELKIPIIALSQLSRNVEQRGGNKRPQLSDLRESGAIEQDADAVIFIYRAEYYQITEFEDGSSAIGMAKLIIAKNRHGALDDVDLRFKGSLGKFSDLDDLDDNLPTATYLNENNSIKPNNSFDDSASFSSQNYKPNNDDGDTPF
jgi:replicative DNA helicase